MVERRMIPEMVALRERLGSKTTTAIAASEIPASSEDIGAINDNVESIRAWIMNPDHSEWVEDGLFDGYRLSRAGKFEVSADDPERTSEASVRLLVITHNLDYEISISFGFDNDFQLEIGFRDQNDPEHNKEHYDSDRKSLQTMTDEEEKIIRTHLKEYADLAGIPIPNP